MTVLPLDGRIALVAGGASGLGAAIAEHCAAEGAVVVVADSDEAGAGRVAETITRRGGRAEAVATDITDDEDVSRAIEHARALGPLRALVLAATVETRGSLLDCTDEEWQRVLDLDLKGPFLCMRGAVPAITEAGGGSIVALGSPLGLVPRRGSAAFATANGALVNLCKQVAVEHAADDVRVNVVSPWAIDVGPIARADDAFGHPVERRSRFAKTVPMGRMGTVEGVCDTVVFLLSDASEFLSGAVVPLDGGLAARRA